MRTGMLLIIVLHGAFGAEDAQTVTDNPPVLSPSPIQMDLDNLQAQMNRLENQRIQEALDQVDRNAAKVIGLAQIIVAVILGTTVIFIAVAGFLSWNGYKLEQRGKEGVAAIEKCGENAKEKLASLEAKIQRADEAINEINIQISSAKLELEGIKQTHEEYKNSLQIIKDAKPGQEVDEATEKAALKVAEDPNAALTDRLMAQALIQEKKDSWEEALSLWKAIEAIQEDNVRAILGIGYCSGKLADKEQDPQKKQALLENACRKYEVAVKRDDTLAVAWNNWGVALGCLAEIVDTKEKKRTLLENECQKYEEAVKRDDTYMTAWYNWGVSLGNRAKIADIKEQKMSLLEDACLRHEVSLKCDDTDATVWNNWGTTLRILAGMEEDPTKIQELYQNASGKCQRAEDIEPGSGCYGFACIAAQQGDSDACKRWLEKAEALGKLPSVQYLADDRDMESVREESWFKELLARQ